MGGGSGTKGMKEVEVGSGGRRSWEEGSRWKEGGGERKGKREIGGKEGERRRPTKSHVHNGRVTHAKTPAHTCCWVLSLVKQI